MSQTVVPECPYCGSEMTWQCACPRDPGTDTLDVDRLKIGPGIAKRIATYDPGTAAEKGLYIHPLRPQSVHDTGTAAEERPTDSGFIGTIAADPPLDIKALLAELESDKSRAHAAESALAQREAELKEAVGLLRDIIQTWSIPQRGIDLVTAFLARTGEGTTPPAEGKET